MKASQFVAGPRFERLSIDRSTSSATNIVRAGDRNRRSVLQVIRAHGPIGRGDIARHTGLTPPAAFKIANGLLDEAAILKSSRIEGGKGQPTSTLVVNPDFAFSLGLNIDRDHLTLVTLDFAGKIRARTSLEVKFATPFETKQFLQAAIERITDAELVPVDRLVGIGIAIPDQLGTTTLPDQPAQYRAWKGTDPETLVREISSLPVFQENDAAAAAIGEMHFGHGLKASSFFYILISAGLGGGLVVNGKYHRGAHGRSGELGFLPLYHPFRSRLSDPRRMLGDAVLLSDLFSNLKNAGIAASTPDDLKLLSGADLDRVHDWIVGISDLLYLPLLTIMFGVDPEAVYIGGRLPPAIIDRLCHELNLKLSMHADFAPATTLVQRAALSADAAAIGAAILPFENDFLPLAPA